MQYLALLTLPAILLVGIVQLLWMGGEWLVKWFRNRRKRRIARIEADLDRQAGELRSTILSLAQQLGGDAHEARKALIRESFLASGKVPPRDL